MISSCHVLQSIWDSRRSDKMSTGKKQELVSNIAIFFVITYISYHVWLEWILWLLSVTLFFSCFEVVGCMLAFKASETVHRGPQKNVSLYFCLYLCQLLTDFQNSLTSELCRQFAIMRLLYILSLIHIWRCRRIERCRSRWSPYH